MHSRTQVTYELELIGLKHAMHLTKKMQPLVHVQNDHLMA